jgi:flavin-dependent dehydrogenase
MSAKGGLDLPMNRADVIVVGAGPAGSTAALMFARAGFDVLIVDRHAFPRPKPCGECMSPEATRVLDRLGLLDAVVAEHPARLAGWCIVSPDGSRFEGRFADVVDDPLASHSLALSRHRLDAVLLDAAQSAGARVRTRIHVTGVESGVITGRDEMGEPFSAHARLVVGADGLRSTVARRIGATRRGPLRKVSLTAHMHGVDIDPGMGEMHLARGACAGVAPVESGDDPVCNVTLVTDVRQCGRELAADAETFLRAWLGRFPGLRGRVERATIAGDAAAADAPARSILASGPFDSPARFVTARGIALVGDAAGYYDPFTGQGITQAMAGSIVLAREAVPLLHAAAATGPLPPLPAYARQVRRLVRGPRLVQRMIEAVISRPALADFALARLARAPAAGRALLAVTGDLAPARSLFAPGVLLAFAGLTARR